jgi:hypothetical protein
MEAPNRHSFLMTHFNFLVRWPVGVGLIFVAIFQLFALAGPIIKAEPTTVQDVIQPVNTVILAVLWWRISQLEKFQKKMEERDERERPPHWAADAARKKLS